MLWLTRLPLAAFLLCLIPCSVVMAVSVKPEHRVEMVGRVPTFIIDGRPHSGTCYSSYDTHPPRLERRARQFAEAGCDLFNFVVEIAGYGYSRPMWKGPDEWDFSHLDERAHTILTAAPDAWLLPRIYIDAPAWWCEQNPGEMMLLDDGSPSFGKKLFALSREGNYPSLASAKWREDMRFALETVIEHVEHSDYAHHVVGYQLSGQKTEEWYHWSMNAEPLGDYSPHMQAAFRAWLRERYGSDEALVRAWRRSGATIAGARIPSQAERFGDRTKTFRDPIAEAHVIDFHRFWQEIMADTISYFAHVVKDRTGGQKIVGAFYAYTFEFTDLAEDAGHLACWKLIRSPDIDFVMAPSSYFDRNLPGKPYFRAPITSLHHHGMIFWNDFDQVSYKYYDKLKEDANLKTWEWQMGLTQTPEEFVWMCRREVGMELAQGVQLAFFDIHGGYYEDPVIMQGVKQLIDLRNEALKLPDRGSNAQILLLVDEDSEHYFSFRNPLLRTLLSEQIAELPFVAPYDTALLSDLPDLDLHRYRLVLVLNAVKLDAAQRRLLKRRLCRDDRTIVWLYAPGYFTEAEGNVRNIEDVTRIRLVGSPDEGLFVADPRATPLVTEGEQTLAARRALAEWTSVYSAGAPLRAPLLKQLAAASGVHIYDADPDHAVFANRHFLTLCADRRGGRATIRLPRTATVTDAATGDTICSGEDAFRVELQPKEVRIFRLR